MRFFKPKIQTDWPAGFMRSHRSEGLLLFHRLVKPAEQAEAADDQHKTSHRLDPLVPKRTKNG